MAGGLMQLVAYGAINPVTGGAPVAVGIYSPCRDPDESGHRGRYAVRAGERERGSGGVSAPRNLRGEVGSLQRIFCREPKGVARRKLAVFDIRKCVLGLARLGNGSADAAITVGGGIMKITGGPGGQSVAARNANPVVRHVARGAG